MTCELKKILSLELQQRQEHHFITNKVNKMFPQHYHILKYRKKERKKNALVVRVTLLIILLNFVLNFFHSFISYDSAHVCISNQDLFTN